ncbi:ABC transporter ATP-binding protein (plasmid) [Aminobacter sp. UC22_36]|uniref:ABC transporter ATP-binding protein n=1 Tax=Aminobacter sp. UC22_36 TaxID=3374549 RepID=UPI003757053F
MTSAAFIEIRNLSKAYGAFRALNDVDLDVGRGEFLSVLGPSGSGKTTLLMALAGFVRPDRGRIGVDGRDLVRLPANKRGIGVVFQNYALFPHMNVAANVMFPLRVRGVGRAEAAERARKALDIVDLASMADRDIATLSGGQKQRVALARAVVFEPRLMLMDEPLSALDKNLREQMQYEIRKLHDRLGLTTVYVTHDQREALTMSDRIAVMRDGVIRQLGTPASLYHRPTSRFVAEFLGEANILELDTVESFVAPKGTPGTPDWKLMIRAEGFSLADASGHDQVSLDGKLARSVFQGDSWLITVDLATGGTVSARIAAAEAANFNLVALPDGAPLKLHVRRDALIAVTDA